MLRNKIAGLILLLSGIIFFHNVLTYSYSTGMDYLRRTTYARIISHEFRLPTYMETSEVYDAPLFYFVSGLAARLISIITGLKWLEALGMVRFGSAILAIASFWLWHKIWLNFYPKSKFGAEILILLMASLPIFYKAGAMYVSELLTLFLATISWYYFINYWLITPDVKHTVKLSLLASLGLLNRISFLAVLLALLNGIIIWSGTKNKLILAVKPITIILLINILITSWFYVGRYQGTILNVSMDEAAALKAKNLGWESYFHIPLKVMMKYPFRPVLSGPVFIGPLYYSDFWGDYWNYFPQSRFGKEESTQARLDRQVFSPARKKYLAWQNQVNLVPSLLFIISFLYLLISRINLIKKKKINLKATVELAFLTMIIFAWTSLLILVTKYKGQGDLIKATYTVYITPVYVYATVVFLFEFCAKKTRLIFWLALAVLLLTAANNFIFSWF